MGLGIGMVGWTPIAVHRYSEEGKQVASGKCFNLMSDFAIRLGHATDDAGERAGLEIHRSKSKCD